MSDETPLMVEIDTIKTHEHGGLIYDPGDRYEAPANEADRMVELGWVKRTKTSPVTRQAAKDVGRKQPHAGRPIPVPPRPYDN